MEGGKAGGFGNFMQGIDATPYRGKSVLLHYVLRASGKDGRAQPWVRVDRPKEVMGWFDNSGDRPVKAGDGKEYTTVTLAGKVDDDATAISVGVMVFGSAVVWVQSVTIEAGEVKNLDVAAAPLSDRGLENLRAFAKMYGQVKYFHPSEAAFKADWVTVANEGVQRVEGCADAAALAAALREVFAGVGVGVEVWAGDAAPALPEAPAIGTRVTGWQHFGVSFGPEFANPRAGGIYKSTRVKEEMAGEDGRKLPTPGTFAKGSAAGVSWRVPVVLPLDARGFTAEAAGKPLVGSRPDTFRASGNDRVTRLADVVIAWNVFEHFFPYFDVVKTDWDGTLTRSLREAASDADGRAFLGTLRRLVGDLHDGHGSVNHGGLFPAKGMPMGWRFLGEALVVTSDGGGLKAGDRVEKVDGRPVSELYSTWRAQTSAATEQWARYSIARSLLVYAPTGDPSSVEVERDGAKVTVSVPLVTIDKLVQKDPSRPASGTVVGKAEGFGGKTDIVYFNLDGGKIETLTKELDKLNGAAGIVFDLRGYPDSAATEVLRHLTDEPIESARWIVPSVTMPGGQGGGGWNWQARGRWNLPPIEPRWGGTGQPVVFLTDGRAISYAESCMGIVEAYKLGEIVGSATAGTNGNVNPFVLPGGYSMSWTGMRVLKHDGSTHHGVAIAATVACEPTRAGLAAGKDEVLEKGVEVIREKLAK
jgi:C-terminal processing protease CtpA/Prc